MKYPISSQLQGLKSQFQSSLHVYDRKAYPNYHKPYRGLPDEIRIKIWKHLLYTTIRVAALQAQTYLWEHFSRKGHSELGALITCLLCVSKEVHEEIKSATKKGYITFDLRGLVYSQVGYFFDELPVSSRIALRGFHIRSSQIGSLNQLDYYQQHMEGGQSLRELVASRMSPIEEIQVDEWRSPSFQMLVKIRDELGYEDINDIPADTLREALSRLEPNLPEDCQLDWYYVVLRWLLDPLEDKTVRQITVHLKYSNPHVGEYIKADGGLCVLNPLLAIYGSRERLVAKVSLSEMSASYLHDDMRELHGEEERVKRRAVAETIYTTTVCFTML